jgi:crotonobetainyl-CoA:carnitine CoA-transferase CaiB-like acyl-CoA transferase
MLPFAGLRVVDFSQEIAGPYAAMLLAEQGADVVKIEPPEGDPGRRLPGFAVWNRSKVGATCDLASESGRGELERLLRLADILLTSWSPGQAPPRLGPDEIEARQPHLVHLWLPPFGSRGPESDGFPDDALVAAAAGLLGGQPSASGEPVYLTIPFASYGAAFVGVSAVAAALLARERIGRGQLVEVSWLAGALAMTTGSMINALEGGVLRLMQAQRSPLGALPSYRLYECGDDQWLFLACGNSTFFNKMALAIGQPELVSDERFQNAPWGIVDPEARAALAEVISERLSTDTRDNWLEVFDDHDVPAAPVGRRQDFLEDPQVIANSMRVEIDDPALGKTVQMGVPLQIGEQPAVPLKAAPVLGERPIESLWSDLPARNVAPPPSADRPAEPPLDGIRVLDLSFYIAGPLGPMMLADYGADVIKVEPPTGDPFREIAIGFLGWNRGKRSIALDLSKTEGKEILFDLVRSADALVENYRPGVTSRLGIDFDTLKAINPHLVYCSVAGNGFEGPRRDRPAFDPLLQARSGAMAAQGGDGPPVFFAVPLSDHAAALLNAYGVLAGLWMRQRTGEGCHVRLSLTNSTLAAQSGQFVFGSGVAAPENFESEATGTWPGYAAYPCRDGWCFVACRNPQHWVSLLGAFALGPVSYSEAIGMGTRSPLGASIREKMAALEVSEALSLLTDAGTPCGRLRAPLDMFSAEQVLANDLLVDGDHSTFGPITQTGLLARFSITPGRVQGVAPLCGEHTEQILAEIGGASTQARGDRS